MSAPKPAEPSEGAMFLRLRDVPEGWNFRDMDQTGIEVWSDADHAKKTRQFHLDCVVEARPKPEPLVAVMLPRSDAEWWAAGRFGEPHLNRVVGACEAALAEADR